MAFEIPSLIKHTENAIFGCVNVFRDLIAAPKLQTGLPDDVSWLAFIVGVIPFLASSFDTSSPCHCPLLYRRVHWFHFLATCHVSERA